MIEQSESLIWMNFLKQLFLEAPFFSLVAAYELKSLSDNILAF